MVHKKGDTLAKFSRVLFPVLKTGCKYKNRAGIISRFPRPRLVYKTPMKTKPANVATELEKFSSSTFSLKRLDRITCQQFETRNSLVSNRSELSPVPVMKHTEVSMDMKPANFTSQLKSYKVQPFRPERLDRITWQQFETRNSLASNLFVGVAGSVRAARRILSNRSHRRA